MSYHDTTTVSPADQRAYERKARTQEGDLLDLFERSRCLMPDFTPSEIGNIRPWTGVPLTSIRRALTNLTSAGKLVKTDVQRTGMYGRPERAWRLAEPVDEQLTLFRDDP